MTVLPSRLIDYGIGVRAKDGFAVSGDLYAVRDSAEGVLIAVVDGLGHGAAAAQAARAAIFALCEPNSPITDMLTRCHDALVGTRGAVMALATLAKREREMIWVGVGNVEGRLVRRTTNGQLDAISMLNHGGILGHRLPAVRPATVELRHGDLIVFATDGLDRNFDVELRPEEPPQVLADRVLARCGKSSDDALILAARWMAPNAKP